MTEVKLWRKNSFGIGTWRIWDNGASIFIAHTPTEGGAEVFHSEAIKTNQSGRTLAQQIELEKNSRISRQLDKGYKRSREEAQRGSTNQLGLINPMLAQPLDQTRLRGGVQGWVQRKYDGHRCLITKTEGDVIAYSRRGNQIETVTHLLQEASRWLPEGITLDGELYIHGRSLQSLSSVIKRKQPDNEKLQFHWYDITTPETFDVRLKLMQELSASIQDKRVHLVPTFRVERMSEVYAYFKQFRAEGYEGAMLRRPLCGYEDGKRSSQLVKVKERLDSEVTVLSMRPSSDGWAILRVRTDWGTEFDVSAPGSVAEKTEVLRNPDKYLNRRLTIEYAGLTADRIPFHCVAIRWRDDI